MLRLSAIIIAVVAAIAPASAQTSAASSCMPPAWAKQQAGLKTNQFDYQYVEPKNPAHLPIQEMLKKRRLLEHLQEFLSPICLPERIALKVEGCDGPGELRPQSGLQSDQAGQSCRSQRLTAETLWRSPSLGCPPVLNADFLLQHCS
jgi:hypothetical protein